nr:GMC family oxidoreductase N-terminal domain-containing protein [Streptomyces nanshensis]
MARAPDAGIERGRRETQVRYAVPASPIFDPTAAWHCPTRPSGPARQTEYWVRGKTLGGPSAVNGMVPSRGSRADYDALAGLGDPERGWNDMLPVFTAIEDHRLGASELRGARGPLYVSAAGGGDPLLDRDRRYRARLALGSRCG